MSEKDTKSSVYIAARLTRQRDSVKHDIGSLDGITEQPTIHPVSQKEAQKETKRGRLIERSNYLIASIVEPFIFVKSNHVTKFRLMSDSLIRLTVA